MKLKNVSFEQWERNHPPDHDDKWCRELYPFHVFRRIEFGQEKINTEQKIEFNNIDYYATIKKIELQENGRYRTTFDISTHPKTNTQSWKQRKWDTKFQIVYSQEFGFITVFTKKEDPSKDFVVQFMKGNFQRISENKSIPVSELLIRTLILYVAEDGFSGGKHSELFPFLKNGVRELEEHSQFETNGLDFAPIYSKDRNLWICYSFNEDKAHRIAIYNANQCHNLIVVFCNPTYTRHHRCLYPNTHVISLYEYTDMVSSEVRRMYEGQIRFLQNHLNNQEELNADELLQEIINPTKDSYEIQKSQLMEALGVMKIHPNNDQDFFHSLCAINLINAFLSRQRADKQLNDKKNKLFRNMYYFKTYLSDILTERINNNNFSIPIYITKEMIMVEINDFQFSFHNMPLNQTLIEFEKSPFNKEIEWSEKRLQPIAPLLLNYSRALRQRKNIPH